MKGVLSREVAAAASFFPLDRAETYTFAAAVKAFRQPGKRKGKWLVSVVLLLLVEKVNSNGRKSDFHLRTNDVINR